MGFLNDLSKGTKAEDIAIQLIEKTGWVCTKSKRGEVGWDFEAQKDTSILTFEVKWDKMSDITNNIAIEYFNPKRNSGSGITVSTADFWIYCFGNPLEIHAVSLKFLKEYVDRNPPFKLIQVGGDNNASLMLYKKDTLISELFWRIDNIDENELNTGLQNYINTRNSDYYNEAIPDVPLA